MKRKFILKSLNFFIKTSRFIFWTAFTVSLCHFSLLMAAEEEVRTKKTTTQSVGGLLFDVDEGVKVEQGAGGSVYVKSNREYMQEKFAALDQKIKGLEERVALLESHQTKTKTQEKAAKEDSRQVLVG